jgi:hypothetical protein
LNIRLRVCWSVAQPRVKRTVNLRRRQTFGGGEKRLYDTQLFNFELVGALQEDLKPQSGNEATVAGNNWAWGQTLVFVVLGENTSNVRFGLKKKHDMTAGEIAREVGEYENCVLPVTHTRYCEL